MSLYALLISIDGIVFPVGAKLIGRYSDRILVKWRKLRSGVAVPEDRLRATLIGALAFVPVSVLISGFLMEHVKGCAGLVPWLFLLFINGAGVRAFMHTAFRLLKSISSSTW